jgi:hypothetical protein
MRGACYCPERMKIAYQITYGLAYRQLSIFDEK